MGGGCRDGDSPFIPSRIFGASKFKLHMAPVGQSSGQGYRWLATTFGNWIKILVGFLTFCENHGPLDIAPWI